MIVKLLTEHHLEFLSLKGGCKGSSESTLVKMSNCWKSHAPAQIISFQHGAPAFTAPQQDRAMEVLKNRAKEREVKPSKAA